MLRDSYPPYSCFLKRLLDRKALCEQSELELMFSRKCNGFVKISCFGYKTENISMFLQNRIISHPLVLNRKGVHNVRIF